MTTDPWPPCPNDKRGRHEVNVILPEHDEHPVMLFCAICGMTQRQTMAVPAPLDDLTADDLRKLAARHD